MGIDEGGCSAVSIPRRYAKNNHWVLGWIQNSKFQSLVGTLKTHRPNHVLHSTTCFNPS